MHILTETHSHIYRGATAFAPLRWLLRAFATRHQRLRLDELDDHLLRDIGVDRRTAYYEAHRPFWDMR